MNKDHSFIYLIGNKLDLESSSSDGMGDSGDFNSKFGVGGR
jgi:hypothetical protein